MSNSRVSDASAHLSGHLRRLIALQGPLSLADFMHEAMWHPSWGYYATSRVLGAAGDYVTAPEISQMFGELIGLWCGVAWQSMGSPRPFRLIELGPGRGLLMADLLRAARLVPGFLESARIHLLEASEGLRAAQRERLAGAEIAWHEDLAGIPEGPAVMIANEFLDALPILQLERDETGWRERLVDWDEAGARFRFARASHPTPAQQLLPPKLAAAPSGSIAEISPAAIGFVAAVAERLVAQGGLALFIDYGPAESSPGPTLQALHRHTRHDPFEAPGSADLTAHVDFATLKRAARETGAAVHGPVEQGVFLERLGIRARADRLQAMVSAERARDIRLALGRLIDPSEMGTLFKAMAIAAPALGVPAGFEEAGQAPA
jgi:NADH dehydrogenase [ubiquinone] 1 alpha subcomplex assembly factor 7